MEYGRPLGPHVKKIFFPSEFYLFLPQNLTKTKSEDSDFQLKIQI